MTILTIVASLAMADPGASDYVLERRAAIALVRAGKRAEALEAFLRLEKSAATPEQKTDALREAVRLATDLNRHEQATELIKRIPLAPQAKLSRMQLLAAQRQWPDIVGQFGTEDIDAWPEGLRGEAYFERGHAWFVAKNGRAAAADLAKAAEFLTDGNALGLCLNQLGDVQHHLLRDDASALEAYRRVYATGNVYKHCQAAMNVAAILGGRQQYDAALRELQRIKLEDVTAPVWRGRMLGAYGAMLAAAGKKAEAMARYREALRVKGLPDAVRADLERSLAKLEKR